MLLIDTVDFANFWDPKSQETLIFNNFVGGASIFCYDRSAYFEFHSQKNRMIRN